MHFSLFSPLFVYFKLQSAYLRSYIQNIIQQESLSTYTGENPLYQATILNDSMVPHQMLRFKEFLREKKKEYKWTESWLFDSSKPHNYIQKHKNFQLKCHISRDNWNSKTKIKSLTAVRNGFKLIKLQVKIVSGKKQNP